MRIIAAIDIIGGECVRLTRGDYKSVKVYYRNPLDAARSFQDNGIQYLHLVDLDGARSQHIVNHGILEAICTKTTLKVDFGGGIKSDEDVRIAFECGAKQITGGSIAVRDRDLFLGWLARYGADRIILGADSNNRRIVTNGWEEESGFDLMDFIKEYEKEGIERVICTDVAKDGMLQGASDELYRQIIEETSVKLVASGGVSEVSDLIRLKEMGCEGAIVGKAIYEGRITLKQLSKLC